METTKPSFRDVMSLFVCSVRKGKLRHVRIQDIEERSGNQKRVLLLDNPERLRKRYERLRRFRYHRQYEKRL